MTLITENMEICAWLIILLAYVFGSWVIITEIKSFIRYIFWLFFIASDDEDDNE